MSGELALNLALSVVVIGLLVAMLLLPSAVEAQSPPLAISKSASPDPVVAGNELTYIIIITSTGHVPLARVVTTDAVPANTTFILVSSRDGDWWMQTPPTATPTPSPTPVPPTARPSPTFLPTPHEDDAAQALPFRPPFDWVGLLVGLVVVVALLIPDLRRLAKKQRTA